MSNEEVEVLLKEIDITKIEDRDSQEVFGYFETLDLISESNQDIEITESSLKNLHNILKYLTGYVLIIKCYFLTIS